MSLVAPIGPIMAIAGMGLPASGDPPPPVPAAILSLPERLTAIQRPVTLGATVIAMADDTGIAQLRTPLGDILLRPATPLAPHQPVTVQIQPGSPPGQATVLLPAQAAPPAPVQTPATPALAAPTPVPVGPGSIVTGHLYPAPVPALASLPEAKAPPSRVSLPPASGPTNSHSLVEAPSHPDVQQQRAPEPGLRAPAGGIFAPALPREAARPPAPPRPVAVEILAIGDNDREPDGNRTSRATAAPLPPSGTAAKGSPAPAAGTSENAGRPILSGVVVGTTTQKLPIVSTSEGLLVLDVPDTVAVGEKLVLTLTPQGSRSTVGPEIVPLPLAVDGEWPSLNRALRTLEAQDSAAALQLRTSLPKAGPQLAPALALFLAFLKPSQSGAWPGKHTLDALRDAKQEDLAATIGSDLSWAAEQAREPDQAGWRFYTLPFFDEGQVTRVQLAVRRGDDGDESDTTNDPAGGQGSTRFVVEVSPSRLGRVQLDGLLRRQELNMVLRCRHQLPSSGMSELKGLFARTLEATGLTGALSVQAGKVDWVAISQRRPRLGTSA